MSSGGLRFRKLIQTRGLCPWAVSSMLLVMLLSA